ncbi:hypothetical protein [Streptomyces sp. NRRL S-350]|uniref:hypothetical protein n=1 Tax=Streptomyces sp. NRRL S-350 TaxID=1463902 RepID=UPI0004BF6A58|nr:hypothetical protein [Streptomyces sp. NRRL S-350]
MPDRPPEQLHRVGLCPHCGGLEATVLQRVPGLHSLTIHTGLGTQTLVPSAMYIGPIPEPCPEAVLEAPVGE